MKCLLLIIVSVVSILSLPTHIRRNGKSPSCTPNACIVETASCVCGFEESPNDACCDYKCRSCLSDFTFPTMTFGVGPLNFFPLGTFNLSGVDFSWLGRR